MRWMTLAVLLVALAAAGCDSSSDPFNQPKRQVQPEMVNVTIDPGTPVAPPPPPSTSAAASTPATPAPSKANVPPPPPPPPPAKGETTETPAAPPAENVVREEAKFGVGKKGRNYEAGIVTTPVAAYFGARERVAFEIQIPHAMNLYKATNGSGPKSHEEFMQKIIKENAINLPQLPDGHRYVYDPQTEQLMVERPK